MSETQYTDIRAALTAQLNTMTGVPAVAWENSPYTPVVGIPYLKPTILWAESFQAELGVSGANNESGIYQITVNYPLNQGMAPINSMVGKLRSWFKRGTILTYNGLYVTIRKVSLGPLNTGDAWISQPVSISFYTRTSN